MNHASVLASDSMYVYHRRIRDDHLLTAIAMLEPDLSVRKTDHEELVGRSPRRNYLDWGTLREAPEKELLQLRPR